MASIKTLPGVFKAALSNYSSDKVPRLSASLAYYTIFSMSPLFVLVVAIAGLYYGGEEAREQLFRQMKDFMGEQGAGALQSVLAKASNPSSGVIASIIAGVTLLLGATGVFVELQDALNTIWNVRLRTGQGIKGFLKNRMLTFAMVAGIGFLLLVSLILTAVLAGVGKFMGDRFPLLEPVGQVLNLVVSFLVITLLFAMIFKILPDVRIKWSDVWVGAALTSFFFNVGKFLIGYYLGKNSVSSAYGAAGSLVVILLWVYYSTQILFFGAEFTEVYANRYGGHLAPSNGAEFMGPRVKATAV
ncbi:MAG TPA: YihY/virulence factor BrkB family protein [Candidatus Saccharimonadales bacterium]|nr:YihY/virulence factor BrkB family protein [Candidatus Saccharimonadales bacterium]